MKNTTEIIEQFAHNVETCDTVVSIGILQDGNHVDVYVTGYNSEISAPAAVQDQRIEQALRLALKTVRKSRTTSYSQRVLNWLRK